MSPLSLGRPAAGGSRRQHGARPSGRCCMQPKPEAAGGAAAADAPLANTANADASLARMGGTADGDKIAGEEGKQLLQEQLLRIAVAQLPLLQSVDAEIRLQALKQLAHCAAVDQGCADPASVGVQLVVDEAGDKELCIDVQGSCDTEDSLSDNATDDDPHIRHGPQRGCALL